MKTKVTLTATLLGFLCIAGSSSAPRAAVPEKVAQPAVERVAAKSPPPSHEASGNAYVTGDTFSINFPTTPGAFQTTSGGSATDQSREVNAHEDSETSPSRNSSDC